MGTRERDLEMLIPVASICEDEASESSTPPAIPTASHGREVPFFFLLASIHSHIGFLEGHDVQPLEMKI
ncbi:hypothetical protein F3Y22_tig00002226pilonHSYRG00002 [Hibiscus syriacus]|uniref:Uncharacterized protein n=1 Tax=Hibiscus syriacus TaxID=106335 RepID=A0A6A3CV79_HIBSY|nr:hypothetical protein F3Y22_tig00002226pilonHSYRG00002 [Hibiscus syriacus]